MKKYKAKLVKNEIDGRWRLFIPGIHDPILQDVKVYPYLPIAESAGDLVSTAQTGCGYGSMMTNSDLFQLGQLSGNAGSQLIAEIPAAPIEPPTPPISASGIPGSDWDISQDPFWKFIFAGGGVGRVSGVGALSEMSILAEANPYEIRNVMMAEQTSPETIDLSKVKHRLSTEIWVWVFLREDNEDEPIIIAKANTQFPKIEQAEDGTPTAIDEIVQFPTVNGDNGLNFKDTFFNWNDTTFNQSRFVSFASNQYEQSHLVAPNSKLQGLTSSTIVTTNPNAQKHAGVVESTYGLESPKYHPVNTVYEFGMNTAIPINKHGWWAEDWLKNTSHFQMNANALWPRDRAFDLQVYPHGYPDSIIEAKLYEWQLDYSSDNRVNVSESKLTTPKPDGFSSAAYSSIQSIGSGFGFTIENNQIKMFNLRLTQNAGQSIADVEVRNYLYSQTMTKRYARKNSVLTLTSTASKGYEITIDGVVQNLAPIYVNGWTTYTKNLFTDPNLIMEDKQLPSGMTAEAYAASIPGNSIATGSASQVFYNGCRYEKSGRLSILAQGINQYKDLIVYTCYTTGHEIWWNNTDRIWLNGNISKIIFFISGGSINPNMALEDGGLREKIPNEKVWLNGFDRFSDWNIEVIVKLNNDFVGSADFYIESSDMVYPSGTKIDSTSIMNMKNNPMNDWIASDMKGEVEGRLLNSMYVEDVFALTVESTTCGNWSKGGDIVMQYGKTGQIVSASKNYDAQFPRMHLVNLPVDGSSENIPMTMYGLPEVKNSFTSPFNDTVDAFRNDGQMPIIMYKCPMSIIRYTKNSFPTTVVENDWVSVNDFSVSTVAVADVICWKEVDNEGKSTQKGFPIISPSGQLLPQNLFNPAIHEKRTVELMKVSFNVKCSSNSSKFDKLCVFDIYPFWRRGCSLMDYYLESNAFDSSNESRNMGTGMILDSQNVTTSADMTPSAWTCRVFFRQPKKISKTGISDCVKGRLTPVLVETHSKRFKWDRSLPIERQWLSFKFNNLNQTQRSFVVVKAFACEGDTMLQVSGEETTVTFSDMGFPGIYGTEIKQDLEWPRGKELTYIDYPKPLIRWWIDNVPLFEPRFLINEPEVHGAEDDGGATLKATQADYDYKSSLYTDNHYQILQPPAQVNSIAHINQMPWFIGDTKSSSKPTLIGGQELVLGTKQFDKQTGTTRMQSPMIVLNARRILIHQTDEARPRASITIEDPTFCNEGNSQCERTSSSCCDACMIEPHWNEFVDNAFNIRLTERTSSSSGLASFLMNCFPEDVKANHDNRNPNEDIWGKTLEWITPEYVTSMNEKLDALIENPIAVDTNTKKYQKKFYAWWNYYRQHTFKTTLMYGTTENESGPRYYTESGNEWFPLDYDRYGAGRPFCHVPENLSLRGVDALFPKHIQLAFDWQIPGYSTDDERKQPYNYYPIGK